MLQAEQIQLGAEQVQSSLAILDGLRLQPLGAMPERALAVATPVRPHEINLSGSQVLVWLLCGLASIGLLVWAVLKLWLFGG